MANASVKNDSQVIRREQCPKCVELGRDRSMDNLAVYSDGHTHCFACGHHTNSSGLEHLQNVYQEKWNIKKPDIIALPYDASLIDLDPRGLAWLSKYDITQKELYNYRMRWSKSREMLIIPFYGEYNDLLGWQGRCFKDGYTKYYTQGVVDNIFWIQNLTPAEKHGIILVEDCLSAIKIGRQAGSMPLLGSNLSAIRRVRLKHITPTLIFWLDYDKAKEAYRYAQECQILGFNTKVIVTDLDPKEYTDQEIENILNGINYYG